MIFVSMMLLLLLIDTEVEFYVMMMPQPERNSLDSLAKSQGDALPEAAGTRCPRILQPLIIIDGVEGNNLK